MQYGIISSVMRKAIFLGEDKDKYVSVNKVAGCGFRSFAMYN